MQERLEASAAGRAALSVVIVVLVAAVAAWNLPQSELRRQALRPLEPVVSIAGLEQNWGVFAPDPRRNSIGFEARITYADGSRGVWHVPSGDPFVGAYWDYRWRKWMEWITSEQGRDLLVPTARWILRGELAHGRSPARIELVRRWRPLRPPGSPLPHARWREEVILRQHADKLL